MTFKEVFDRQIITEQHVRKNLHIEYEIDMVLVKNEAEKPEQTQQSAQIQQPEQPQQTDNQEPAMQQPEQMQQPAQEPTPQAEIPVQDQNIPQGISSLVASVVTEGEEEKIVKKLRGKYEKLSDNQKDNIQDFNGVLNALTDSLKDSDNSIDSLTKEIIILCFNNQYQKIKEKINIEKSKIYIELMYGYSLGDSVCVRFDKSMGSDILVPSLLIDNEVVTTSSHFSMEKANQKVRLLRNYEADKVK